MSTMTAKMMVESVTELKWDGPVGADGVRGPDQVYAIGLKMRPVTDKPFDADGNSEDNTFSKWTPCGLLELQVNNPNLFGKFTAGQKFYLTFDEAVA